MSDNYLIIHKSVLPDYYEKVLEARRLLESGRVREVSEAVRRVGISRSTYYKYKDYVFEPAETTGGRKAVLELMLQSLPVLGKASVTLSIDVGGVSRGIGALVSALEGVDGVDSVRLLAVE